MRSSRRSTGVEKMCVFGVQIVQEGELEEDEWIAGRGEVTYN